MARAVCGGPERPSRYATAVAITQSVASQVGFFPLVVCMQGSRDLIVHSFLFIYLFAYKSSFIVFFPLSFISLTLSSTSTH